MTDQILKRVAEIEGYICVRVPTGQMAGGVSMDVNVPPRAKPIMRLKACKEDGSEFNPLTNPADTVALIEKYMQPWEEQPAPEVADLSGIYFITLDGGQYEIEGYTKDTGQAFVVYDKNLPMAVCLAVIEANGGMAPTSWALTRTTAWETGR